MEVYNDDCLKNGLYKNLLKKSLALQTIACSFSGHSAREFKQKILEVVFENFHIDFVCTKLGSKNNLESGRGPSRSAQGSEAIKVLIGSFDNSLLYATNYGGKVLGTVCLS